MIEPRIIRIPAVPAPDSNSPEDLRKTVDDLREALGMAVGVIEFLQREVQQLKEE